MIALFEIIAALLIGGAAIWILFFRRDDYEARWRERRK